MARKSIVQAALAVTLALTSSGAAVAAGVPSAQKITVKLTGDCADKKMEEAEGETECTVSVVVTPKSPTRSFTLQELEPGKRATWTSLEKAKSVGGKVEFDFDANISEDDDEYYRDGVYKFRVTAIRTSKEKAFTGTSLTVTFIPDDTSDDSGDDDEGDTTATTKPKSTATTAPKSTATTPTTPTTTGGHTPTTPGGGSQSWFTGTTEAAMGAFCMPSDPIVYAGATICSGITSAKTLAQFTTLISPLPNAMPSFRRNSFCMQALTAMSSLTLAQRQAKCLEANAGGM